jgi:hypothetical protein
MSYTHARRQKRLARDAVPSTIAVFSSRVIRLGMMSDDEREDAIDPDVIDLEAEVEDDELDKSEDEEEHE